MMQRVGQVLLGVLVLAVWGAVIVRALQKPGGAERVPQAIPVVDQVPLAPLRNEVPHLELSRDPFLEGSTAASRGSGNDQPGVLVRKPDPAPHGNSKRPDPVRSAPWPAVAYTGSMGNAQDPSDRLAFVTINGKTHMLRAGATVNEMVLKEVLADSVVFMRNGDRKAWARQ